MQDNFFFDEAWFQLFGFVNSQNYRIFFNETSNAKTYQRLLLQQSVNLLDDVEPTAVISNKFQLLLTRHDQQFII
jgi:hypothetical protein